MSSAPGSSASGSTLREVQYLVLSDRSNPFLLARVRWPDIFEAISPARPDWRSDPGLFDLPYDPNSEQISEERAAALAAEWGARLPAKDELVTGGPFLMRRMPANWSALSRAERDAWNIDEVRPVRPARSHRPVLGRFRRRRANEVVIDLREPPLTISQVDPAQVIDLTDGHGADLAKADEA